MGCSFGALALPREIQTPEEVKALYKQLRGDDDQESNTGDIRSDNGQVVVHEEINLDMPGIEAPEEGGFLDLEGTNEEEALIKVLQDTEAEKWGPSIALRINGQWFFAGLYSD